MLRSVIGSMGKRSQPDEQSVGTTVPSVTRESPTEEKARPIFAPRTSHETEGRVRRYTGIESEREREERKRITKDRKQRRRSEAKRNENGI